MEEKELAKEMLNFLNEMGQYQNFLDFMEDRGSDRDLLESNLDKL